MYLVVHVGSGKIEDEKKTKKKTFLVSEARNCCSKKIFLRTFLTSDFSEACVSVNYKI